MLMIVFLSVQKMAQSLSFQAGQEVKLRDYQQKLVETIKNQNTIIFLPTGSGKTFIAIEVIRLKSEELKK